MAPDKTPSAERGDIQAGKTGDKTPGFDPAMAPMETDAEAGGTPTEGGIEPLAKTPPQHTNQTSYASAMRPPAGHVPGKRVERGPRNRTLVISAIAVMILLVVIVLFSAG